MKNESQKLNKIQNEWIEKAETLEFGGAVSDLTTKNIFFIEGKRFFHPFIIANQADVYRAIDEDRAGYEQEFIWDIVGMIWQREEIKERIKIILNKNPDEYIFKKIKIPRTTLKHYINDEINERSITIEEKYLDNIVDFLFLNDTDLKENYTDMEGQRFYIPVKNPLNLFKDLLNLGIISKHTI